MFGITVSIHKTVLLYAIAPLVSAEFPICPFSSTYTIGN